MIVKFGKNSFEIPVREAGAFGKFIGLMFKFSSTENLSFSFPESTHIRLHSWFVFFDFYVLWLDKKNKVIEFKKIRPFTTIVSCSKKFNRIVEIPVNGKNKRIVGFLDGKQKI